MKNTQATDKQQRVLDYVREQIKKDGYAPSVRDICKALDLKSTSTVHGYLARLEKKGLIQKAALKPRTLRIVGEESEREEDRGFYTSKEMVDVPIVGRVTAGMPILAVENIEDSFYDQLKRNRTKDMEKGLTSVGPHRDDFIVLINDIDTKSYGSQGQQRSAVLTMKFSSLKIIKELTSEYPVLLLDDVLSELDFNRKRYILSTIGEIQTIITCTGIEDLTNYLDDSSKVFKVKDGEILN